MTKAKVYRQDASHPTNSYNASLNTHSRLRGMGAAPPTELVLPQRGFQPEHVRHGQRMEAPAVLE